jgi:hypothetical protein
MPSDASLDQQIRTLEQRIRDRREAMRESYDELRLAAADVKDRVRARAASPAVWGGALLLGFVAARFAHRRPQPRRATLRVEKPQSAGRQILSAVLAILVPVAVRIAQHSAGPWLARAVHDLRENLARKRAYQRAYRAY